MINLNSRSSWYSGLFEVMTSPDGDTTVMLITKFRRNKEKMQKRESEKKSAKLNLARGSIRGNDKEVCTVTLILDGSGLL